MTPSGTPLTPTAPALAGVTGSATVRTAATSPGAVTATSAVVPAIVAEQAPPRTPLPLAVALGIAVGLVVAAALFRLVSGDVAPAQVTAVVSTVPSPAASAPADGPDVAAPMSAAAGAALTTASPAATETPGRLSVPGDEIVVAADGPTALRLTNSGGAAVDWQIVSRPEWAVLDRLEGSVDPGATVEIQVTHAPALVEGDYVGDVTVEWAGAEPSMAAVQLVGAVERIPELQNLRMGSRELVARGCGQDQSEVEVLVADESPIAEVLVTATGPGPETQTQFPLLPDEAQPGRFVGVVGPFDTAGGAVLEIEAADVRGNRAAAAGGELTVAPCPGG